MASDVIPETGKKYNNFPGLTKETSYLREIVLFWHSILISLNLSRSGIVADIISDKQQMSLETDVLQFCFKKNPLLLFRVPARMVVRRPAPINQLFNDESIAVQI